VSVNHPLSGREDIKAVLALSYLNCFTVQPASWLLQTM